jgi:hypothetical protein
MVDARNWPVNGRRLPLFGRNARGALDRHQCARQVDASDADEAVASAVVAYHYHGGRRRDVGRLIDHPSTRSPRNSPASRGATASNAMGMTSCTWRLRGPSPVASVARLWKPLSQRVAHDAITDADVTGGVPPGFWSYAACAHNLAEMLAGHGTTDTLCPRCVPSSNLPSLCVQDTEQYSYISDTYVVSPLRMPQWPK